MRLDEDGDDAVVGMIVVDNANEETVMVVSEEVMVNVLLWKIIG